MKSRNRISLALLLTMALGFTMTSCMNEKQGKDRSTGKTNEILVVTDTRQQWEGALGDTIRAFFEKEMPGLPQPEPLYNLLNVSSGDFNKTFKKLHSVLIITVDPSVNEPVVEMKKDVWTSPQQVIKMTVKDMDWFNSTFHQYRDVFLKLFSDLETQRTIQYFDMAKSIRLKELLMDKFGFSLDIPGGFSIMKDADGFLWLQQSVHKVKEDIHMGIIIYEQPYTDTSAFNPDKIIERRDSVTMLYVPGPSEGSYMVVSRKFILPKTMTTQEYITGYAAETRGLWMVVNDFMGGPFLSYTFVDPNNETIITLDGYVYNPNGMKRNFIRQLEAIFNTLKFTGKPIEK
ncbi:MAG: DUF4837 family protein [Bacteroidetes bacterium]|nr:DUF4837 family protein [Bacteroidota bacterium]